MFRSLLRIASVLLAGLTCTLGLFHLFNYTAGVQIAGDYLDGFSWVFPVILILAAVEIWALMGGGRKSNG